MKNNSITDIAHLLIKANTNKSDVLVDATMGNGYDTVFLAQIAKFVYAFDIQEKALVETRAKLDKLKLFNTSLILKSHENILDYVTNFKGIIYNLGYLPNGDKSITTTSKTTINSITKVLPILNASSFILLTVYPKHKQGQLESIALSNFLETVDPRVYKIMKINLPFQDNYPPYILFIQKKQYKKVSIDV